MRAIAERYFMIDCSCFSPNSERFDNIEKIVKKYQIQGVVSLIISGKPRNEIAHGLHVSVAKRLTAMLLKFPAEDEMLFVGGRAKNDCLSSLLQTSLGRKIIRPENPQLVVALGAALLLNSER